MIHGVLNNQLVEKVCAGQAAPLQLLLGFGARPSMELDRVEMVVDEYGVETSQVVRKSIWQWAHHAPLGEGADLLATVVAREISTQGARPRITLLRQYWQQACAGALEASQGTPLMQTWQRMLEEWAMPAEELLATFWTGVQQSPATSAGVVAAALEHTLIPTSQCQARTRPPHVDDAMQSMALHARADGMVLLARNGIEPWTRSGYPWAGLVWKDLESHGEGTWKKLSEEQLSYGIGRMSDLLPDAASWLHLLQSPQGAACVETWQELCPVMRERWGHTHWMSRWASNVEQHVLAVTLATPAPPSRPSRRI